MYSVTQVAEHLKCSEQYVRKMIRLGKLNAERVGKTWIIPVDNLEEIVFEVEENKPKNQKVQDRIGKRDYDSNKLNVLSFFSGAMGLDLGLEKAGLNILLACEIDEASKKTITFNDNQVGLIGNLLDYSTDDILKYANINSYKQVDVIVGGPPCQAFSTAGKRMGFQDERGNVFLKFIDIILKIQPKYIVIENVRGLLYTPMSIQIEDDVAKNFDFDTKSVSGSSLYYIKKKLEKGGYNISFNLYNSANFGVPQIRERVVIIGTKRKDKVPYLEPTHSENGIHNLKKWNTVRNVLSDLDCKSCESVNFSENRLYYIKMLTEGQNWKNLPIEIQPEAMGNSFYLGGGKTGFFRRLAWNKPSPTLVTHPAMPATELAHPTEPRPLSIEEYKRIQQFPDEWMIQGSTIDKYRQIGNAVPVNLGYAIGRCLYNHLNNKPVKIPFGFQYSRYRKTSDIEWEVEFKKSIRLLQSKHNKNLLFNI